LKTGFAGVEVVESVTDLVNSFTDPADRDADARCQVIEHRRYQP